MPDSLIPLQTDQAYPTFTDLLKNNAVSEYGSHHYSYRGGPIGQLLIINQKMVAFGFPEDPTEHKIFQWGDDCLDHIYADDWRFYISQMDH